MRIRVRVTPKSRKNTLEISPQGMLLPSDMPEYRARVTAPPEDGKANEAVARLISDHFSVPISTVSLLSGHTSREKVFEF